MADSVIGAGFNYIYFGVVNSSGYLQGSTTAGAAAGASAGMKRLIGARTIPFALPEPEVITVTGDNEPKVSFQFPNAEIINGVFEMASRDLDFEALVAGVKVQTIGTLEQIPIDPSGATSPTMMLLVQRKGKNVEAGSVGTTLWEHFTVLSADITPLLADVTERTFSPYRYAFNLSKRDRAGTGATFTVVADGTIETTMVGTVGSYPIHYQAFQGDGATTAITLDYTPVALANVYVYDNGVRKYPTTHYTLSGKTLTMQYTPTNGAWLTVLYEVEEDNFG